MANVVIELNSDGVKELLKSPEMMQICKEHAEAILNRVGEGYELSTHTGRTRVNAQVMAVSNKAKRDNMKNNTLLKAVK